jgi:hypothetical protein
LTFAGREDIGPGSVFRFRATTRMIYDYGAPPTADALSLTISGGHAPPMGLAWVLAAAIAGLIGGIRLGRRYRQRTTVGVAPAGVLATVLLLGASGILIGRGAGTAQGFSIALLVASAVIVIVGIRRLRSGDPWPLGIATAGTLILCGLWLAWVVASLAVASRIELALLVGALGVLTGRVIGQTWNSGKVGLAGRTVAAFVVFVTQGLLAAGLVFVTIAAASPTDPFVASSSPLALIPLSLAGLVAWGAYRWFDGSGGLMLGINLLLLAVGVIGSLLWFSLQRGGFLGDPAIDLVDVLIVLEVLAALIGVFGARHPLDRLIASPPKADVADAGPESAI